MDRHSHSGHAEHLARLLRDELVQLGLGRVTVTYVPDGDTIHVAWINLRTGTEEGVSFPATPEWAERMRGVLRTLPETMRAG